MSLNQLILEDNKISVGIWNVAIIKLTCSCCESGEWEAVFQFEEVSVPTTDGIREKSFSRTWSYGGSQGSVPKSFI